MYIVNVYTIDRSKCIRTLTTADFDAAARYYLASSRKLPCEIWQSDISCPSCGDALVLDFRNSTLKNDPERRARAIERTGSTEKKR